MVVVLRTVEVVVDVNEQTSAFRTDGQGWGELCSVQCPSVHSIVRWVVVDKDLSIAGDKHTPRIGEVRRNAGCWSGASVEPGDDLTGAPIGHDDGVVGSDE